MADCYQINPCVAYANAKFENAKLAHVAHTNLPSHSRYTSKTNPKFIFQFMSSQLEVPCHAG
ncbi:hypothetical protein TA5114_00020 [Cognatishimia activa]|uniref:Uncharacterized protein n=1 Tax=Cognatishimia activa TaxID=1715691 RepID=A0A0P1IKW0_9RHOB|nr:hypothetical protein TA5113_00052 [Cognatishimia activa]CUK24245.1 hypothetical protein TA5114_00020 [Cognatishimia activa]